jgi:putative ABC transport system substrate-binding protein
VITPPNGSKVPIVAMTDDHVGAGLTDSLSHPSRNVTGVSRLESELDTKRLGLLHELVPAVTLVLVLRDPQTTWPSRAASLEEAAAHSGIRLFVRDIRAGSDVDGAIAAGEAAGAGAVLVLGSPLLTSSDVESRIRRAAMARHLPTMVQIPRQVTYGNLAGYGIDEEATIVRLAQMLDRVLKGTPPVNIPIEQPTKFALSINLQVAREIGLTVPQSLSQRADEVIE